MPRKKQAGGAVRLEDKAINQLRKIVNRLNRSRAIKLKQPAILSTLIEMAEVHDLLRPDWYDRLTVSLERGRRDIEYQYFEKDPDRCPAIARGGEKFKCVWGRKGKPPFIRILEKEYEDSKKLCLSCKKTLLIREENEAYLKQIDQLKHKLQQKVDVTFKVPICHKGATLNEDGSEFSGCPKHRGENVSVEGFCRVYSGGLPCALFAQRVIAVADKESKYGSESNI